MRSPQTVSEVDVARSFVFCEVFVNHFCFPFSFDHCIVCSSSITTSGWPWCLPTFCNQLILSRLVLELLTLQGTTGYSTQHEPVL